LVSFIQETSKLTEPAILKTLAMKGKPIKLADAPATRHRGRLPKNASREGPMCVEKMVQEVLSKKLGDANKQPDKEKQARDQLIQLFDALVPEDVKI
jgi:hypothetical protein